MRLLLITLAWLVIAVPPADASLKAIWGPVKMPDGSSAFPIYEELGVDVFQVQLVWSRAAATRPSDPRSPDDPAYTWPSFVDSAVEQARENGIKVAIMVKGTPAWANAGKGTNWAPDDDRDYTNFLRAAARRYKSVHHWMIWGETNRAAVWQPLPPNSNVGPRRYALLLDAAYGTLKRSDRRNKVIGGMTFTFGDVTPNKWVRWMRLPSGRPPRLDYYGHNPFARRAPKLSQGPGFPGARDLSDVDTFSREIHRAYRHRHRFRRRGPRLWLSEFTVSSDRANRAFDFFVSRAEQAKWVARAFRIAHRHRYVGALGWFALLDEPLSVARGLTTGLMTYEGERKPSFSAYRRAR